MPTQSSAQLPSSSLPPSSSPSSSVEAVILPTKAKRSKVPSVEFIVSKKMDELDKTSP